LAERRSLRRGANWKGARMRFVVAALCLALSAAPAFADDAKPPAQAGVSIYETLEQVALTEDEIKNYIASLDEMQKAMGDAPADAVEPDAKTMANLEAIAKKYGFRDFNEYNTVAGNLALVLDGVDPETKQYVGADTLIQRSIDETKADKQLTDVDKKSAIADMQAQLKMLTPLKHKENVALALKYYDKLTPATDEKPAAK
jgi:hypothetical protein